MLFFSWPFITFFLIAFFSYWKIPSDLWRKRLLLAASYFFYAYWDWRFLGLLIYTSTLDFYLGAAIGNTHNPARRKTLLLISLISNLSVLTFFKYFNFFADSLSAMANVWGVTLSPVTLDIVLPLGISFFTFHSLSYIFDVYLRKIPVCKSLPDFLLYVAFFPQLIAGPIVRARDFLPQLAVKKHLKEIPWKSCLFLFLLGMIKKTCIADNIAIIIDPLFQNPHAYSNTANLLAAYAFAIQIYCDFSGYVDMAIATSRMFGYVIPVNFAWPLLAVNIGDLWRRWNISLGKWFRDYLFLPMGGLHRSPLLVLRNFLIVMALVGLWHGAAWHYVIWGIFQGVALTVYALTHKTRYAFMSKPPSRRKTPISFLTLICWGITFNWFCLSLIFFRASDVPLAFSALQYALFLKPAGISSLTVNIAPFLLLLGALHLLTYHFRPSYRAQYWPNVWYFMIVGVMLAIYILTMQVNNPPFIYFQF